MDHFLSDAKRLVQRLHHHDNAVDILISETTHLQNKLIAMRQYRDEVNLMNQNANHRPRSTLILGSQLENQRIQNLEQENRELSISLAEHQSALELIMNKYREQILVMMKANGTEMSINESTSLPTNSELAMSEKIAEMAYVMRQSAAIDDGVAAKEIEILRSLQVENENLRELLEISGRKIPGSSLPNKNTSLPLTNGLSDNDKVAAVSEPVNINSNDNSDESPETDFKYYKPSTRIKSSRSKYVNSLENLFIQSGLPKESNNKTMKPVFLSKEITSADIQNNTENAAAESVKKNNENVETTVMKGDFLDIFRKNINESDYKVNVFTSYQTEPVDVFSEKSDANDVTEVANEVRDKHIQSSSSLPESDNENHTGFKTTEFDNEADTALQMLDDIIDEEENKEDGDRKEISNEEASDKDVKIFNIMTQISSSTVDPLKYKTNEQHLSGCSDNTVNEKDQSEVNSPNDIGINFKIENGIEDSLDALTESDSEVTVTEEDLIANFDSFLDDELADNNDDCGE